MRRQPDVTVERTQLNNASRMEGHLHTSEDPLFGHVGSEFICWGAGLLFQACHIAIR